MEKLREYNLLKIFGLLMIILFHSMHVYTNGWYFESVVKSTFFRNFTFYLGTFQIPLFVFLSGALFYLGKRKQNKYAKFKELFIKKSRRLLIPYLLLGTFYIVPTRLVIKFYEGKSYKNFIEIVFDKIFLGRGIDPGHLWYVLMLFNLFIVFYFLEKYLNKNIVISLGVLVILNIS
jgi:fucose 4-O-acetylase-like acetyltransferase